MGFDYTDIKDFIEDKGLPELNADYAINAMQQKDSYRNPLYKKPIDGGNAHQSISYDFHDPISKPPMSQPVGIKHRNFDTNASIMQPSEYDTEKDTCKVCLNSQINTVFVPCGHRCVCSSCGDGLKNKICPICRQAI